MVSAIGFSHKTYKSASKASVTTSECAAAGTTTKAALAAVDSEASLKPGYSPSACAYLNQSHRLYIYTHIQTYENPFFR
jgi:hypothetical protein